MRAPLTPRQRAILAAVEAGAITTRAIQAHARLSSTSVVKYNLELLADAGHLALETCAAGARVYDGRDFCAAWDCAARLSGNGEA